MLACALLARPVYAAQEAAKVPGQTDKQDRDRFNRQTIVRQRLAWPPSRPLVDPENEPD